MFTSLKTFSQSNYYYRDDKRQEILLDKKHINLFVNNNFNKSALASLGLATTVWHSNELKLNEQWATLDFESEPNEVEYLQKTNALKNMLGVTGVAKHFKNDNNTTIGTSNLFYVKLKSLADTVTLKRIAIEKKVTLHHQLKYIPQWFALHRNADSPNDVVELTNQFFETQLFDKVDPNFIFETMIPDPGPDPQEPCDFEGSNSSCVNDAMINNQWGLFNEERPNTDINMCEAWAISTGANTKIAVLDSGVQLNHPDLINNIAPQSFDANNNASPSQVYNYHGTFVAGICGAASNNNQGIAGVAPNTKIISVSHPLNGQPQLTTCEKMGYGIYWAAFRDAQADIINNSWGIVSSTFSSALLESYIIDATTNGRLGKGCIMVFAAGNEMYGMRYPANNPNLNLLTVGASRPDGLKATFSSHGPTLDIVAPGVCISSTTIGSSVSIDDGTSFAAPHVAGVAALMLSVNPCLTRQQVYDIIEQTAQKLSPTTYAYTTTPNKPNGTWNSFVGYGLLDAYAATLMAKQMYASSLDLFIKDDTADIGIQPNPATTVWDSPDIWVRNLQGSSPQIHQTPICYTGTHPNYVYVKVRNKGCTTTTGNETVQLFQSTTSTYTNPEMPEMRMANTPSYTNVTNNLIGTVSIPAGLTTGQETILEFSWQVPSPNFLPTPGGIEAQGLPRQSYNLLAKIVTPVDPLAVAETPIAYTNIKNNNNIAGKSVIDIISSFGFDLERVSVGNPFDVAKAYKLELIKEDAETGKAIYDEAEVSIKMDDILYNAWQRGGKQEQNLEQTTDAKKQIVENNQVLIDNIQLNAHEEGFVNLAFNFLTEELTDKTNYKYHIIQRDKATNQIIGGVTYQVNKEPRPVFEALADNQEKDRNETITISAQQISEPAIYNWYDTDGNLIFTGKDLTIATDVAKNYKLEVIATADGFKDYSEVEVTLKPSVLSLIAPNPASDGTTISYKINEGGTAYLMILGGYGTNAASNNYILNPDLSEININLASYSNGFYTVALVVNGQIIDAKTLVKQ